MISPLQLFQKADDIEPRSDTKGIVAYEYARTGDFVTALRYAELSTNTANKDYDKMDGLADQAWYLLHLSRYQEAIEAASKSIAYEDNWSFRRGISRACTYRAEAYYQLGLYKNAADDASKAVNSDFANYKAHELRAKIFERLGLTNDAQADIRTAEICRNWRDF